jgi:hypothetical protein
MRRCIMTIENRNLQPGTRLVGRYHKQQYKCEVVEREGGKLGYRLEDGREFKSPSAAGMAITGHQCDGWIFWTIDTTPAPAAQKGETDTTRTDGATAITEDKKVGGEEQKKEEPAITSTPSKAELPAVKRSFFRTPNQRGVADGQVRWYCPECGKSFLADIGMLLKACPQGHQAS